MPPTPKRQEPPKPQISFPEGSILASAIPVTTLKQKFSKLCIYGRNRSGKTTLAAQFKKPILFISTEPDTNGGADSIADIEGISLIRITPPNKRLKNDKIHGSSKLIAIANELSQNNPFATIVLDTVTSLQDLILVELLGLDKVPELNRNVGKETYQYRAEKWRETVRPIIDLDNCNVVILAQEKDHNPPTDDFGGKRKILGTMQQGSFIAPSVGSTNAQWLIDACGYIIQIYDDCLKEEVLLPQMDSEGKQLPPIIQYLPTNKRQRHLRLLYHPNFAAGGRMTYDKDMPEYVTAPDPASLYAELARYVPALRH